MMSLLIGLLSILALSNSIPFPNGAAEISTELLCLSTTEYDKKNNLKRLPTAVVPYHYDIDIRLSFPTKDIHSHPIPSQFNGTLHLHATVAKHTRNVTVHAWDLNIREVRAYIKGCEIAIERKQEYPCFRQYVVFFEQQLTPGTKLRLTFSYTGAIVPFNMSAAQSGGPLGLFYETYKYNGEDRYIFATQLQQFHARRLGPMMDEPALKATFQLMIGHPLEMQAKSNSPLLKDIGGRFSLFNRTARMSTYLLAIYVGELSARSIMSSSNKTNISMVAWKGMDGYLEPALKAAVMMQDWFGKYFDLPYPLPKQDVAILPEFFGAMENWGLILLASDFSLFDRSLQTQDRRTYKTLAHEIAHQWFGNLVTMKWWDELFLNEALTTFYTLRGQLVAYPKQPKWIEQQKMTEIRSGLKDDASAEHPLVFADGSEADGFMVYEKGMAMISMIEAILGEEHFKKAITNYLKAHAYGNVDRNDLSHELTMVTKEMPDLNDWCGNQLDMKEFTDPWFLQQNFPVVKVRKTTDAARPRFTLSQDNINSSDTSTLPPSDFGYKWPIPIWYRSDHHQREDTAPKMGWLGSGRNNKCQRSDVSVIEAEWLAINVNNRAFIRVQYDDASWDALLQQIRTDKEVFEAEYLAQLLDDLYYFGYSRNGSVSEKKRVYNLIEQLEGIESGSIMTMVNWRLRRVLYNEPTTARKQFMEKLLSPLANKSAWTFSDDYDVRTYQQNAWKLACKNHLFDCRKVAYEAFASCVQEYDAGGKVCASLPPQKWFLLKYGVTSPKVTKRQLASFRSAVAYVKELKEQGGVGYLLTELHKLLQKALEKANRAHDKIIKSGFKAKQNSASTFSGYMDTNVSSLVASLLIGCWAYVLLHF